MSLQVYMRSLLLKFKHGRSFSPMIALTRRES